MANEFCAYGFGEDWDGTYAVDFDKAGKESCADLWTNGSYWIYRNSYYWMISASPYLYDDRYLVARKAYEDGSSPVGSYTGYNGNPDGAVKEGVC